MGKLDGKIALITGGNSGIGLATAKRFVREGAFVFITGRTQSKPKYATLGTIDEEHFDSIFNGNVKGMVFTVQKALPLMPDGASVILNASVVGSKGLPSNSVYAATKAAVRSFARTWTTDLKSRRIRVNAISPGPIDTEGLRELLGSGQAGQDRLNSIGTTVPLGRLGTGDEIAKAAVFLASEDSTFITGIELFVDGGFAQV